MSEWLSDVRVLAVLVAVGAFVLTYAGHRAFTAAKRTLSQALGRSGSTPAATGAAGPTGPMDDFSTADSDAPDAASANAASPAARPRSRDADDVFGVADTPAPASRAAAPARAAGAASAPPRTSAAGRAAAGLISKAHPPRENAFRTVHAEAVDDEDLDDVEPDDLAEDTHSWERLVRDVMSEESVLAENREALSEKRSLKSLLGNIRDRDLLAARGLRIGRSLHATSYADLAEKLAENNVCEEVHFRHAPEGTMDIRVIGTAMAREAPVIGVAACFIETGVLAGALENLEGARFQVRELRCVVKGDPFCEFRAERIANEDKPRSLYDAHDDGGSA